MKPVVIVSVLGAVLIASLAVAQIREPGERMSLADRLVGAIRLPSITQESRDLGVPEDDVRAVLRDARENRIPPGETGLIFEEGNKAVREHGPIDNFGAFVQAQLRAGLRGRALAEAIHAEHAARGIGKGKQKVKDLPHQAKKPHEKGAPAKKGEKGHPDNKGKKAKSGRGGN